MMPRQQSMVHGGAQAFDNMVDLYFQYFRLIKGWIHIVNGNVVAGQKSLIFSPIISAIVSYQVQICGGLLMAIFSGCGAFVVSSVLK